MKNLVENQLHFTSNRRTILLYLKSGKSPNTAPPQFSLNVVRPMPAALLLPPEPIVRDLSMRHAVVPEIDQIGQRRVIANLFGGRTPDKKDKREIARTMESMGNNLSPPQSVLFERMKNNFRQHGYFSQWDWRLENWGTVEDIISVEAATFEIPTERLVFKTLWTPPIAALQTLANTFPSVKFKLNYRYQADAPWTVLDLFPWPPFGY